MFPLESTWPNKRWEQAAPPDTSPRSSLAQAEASSPLPEDGQELQYEFCLAVNIIFLSPFSLPCCVSLPPSIFLNTLEAINITESV